MEVAANDEPELLNYTPPTVCHVPSSIQEYCLTTGVLDIRPEFALCVRFPSSGMLSSEPRVPLSPRLGGSPLNCDAAVHWLNTRGFTGTPQPNSVGPHRGRAALRFSRLAEDIYLAAAQTHQCWLHDYLFYAVF